MDITTILEDCFGECKPSGDELQFNCPNCTENNFGIPDNKHNLSINIVSQYYQCWSCGLKGTKLQYLIDKYSPVKIDWKIYSHLLESKTFIKIYDDAKLPSEYISFRDIDKSNKSHLIAYDYLTKERKLTDYHIRKYKLGFCLEGRYRNRIIIPSYDDNEVLNFFDARSFTNTKPSYLKPSNVSKNIIFFENLIDFNTRIYLVEGVFDAMVIPNATPILGKFLQEKLFLKLIKYNSPVSILLDKDAQKESGELLLKLMNSLSDVNIIEIEDKDPSKIHEINGREGIKKLLKL